MTPKPIRLQTIATQRLRACIFFVDTRKGRFSVTALYILANYQSPERIANMNSRSYESLRKLSRGRFTLSDFVKL